MTVVAIISEYNPFHSGHEHQIRKIREDFGDDTAIVAIMSGNYTQRGEVAFAPKGIRAACAVNSGVDLVLELPFPFSSSSAELFAQSGVQIADKLGIVNYLSFGSESGDIAILENAADITSTDEYNARIRALSTNNTIGYPEKCELAFKDLSKGKAFEFTPNNILAIEYIKALKKFNSKIKPHTVRRDGASYNETELAAVGHQSAMAIRNAAFSGDTKSLNSLPSYNLISDTINSGDMPCSIDKISSAIISKFRLNPILPQVDYHDANDGLYNRLRNASFEANDISSLLELAQTKNYTTARIRRAMLNVFFGVTSSDVKALPAYSQVLAMNKVGALLLKNRTKSDDFKILTKPSSTNELSDAMMRQKRLSDAADFIFELTKPIPKSAGNALRFTPYIKK